MNAPPNPRHFRRRLLAGLTATTVIAPAIAVPQLAGAAPDGSGVVISEVYPSGGNNGAVYNADFVELYNPTDAPISVDGWRLLQKSAANNVGNTAQLMGSIPAGGRLLITGSPGTNGAAITGDVASTIGFGARDGIAELVDATGATVDLLGYGSASVAEGTAAGSPTTGESLQRAETGADTDDNNADFTPAAPTPQGAGGEATAPADPTDPTVLTPIAAIQGTGAASPLIGQRVTTEGVVTASYPEGGLNGFYVQTAGSGGVEKRAGDASDAIFVYVGANGAYPAIGDAVRVSGTVAEYQGLTELTNPTVTAAEADAAVAATELATMSADAAIREAYEGMLVLPTGDYTVTDNFNLNRFGTLGLAAGTQPYRQATDVAEPSTDHASEVQRLMAEQAAELVVLDDARTSDYTGAAKDVPLPYLAHDDATTITPIRTGDAVDFQHPVVFDYRFNAWSFQPTTPVTGTTAAADLPITWGNSRPGEQSEPATVAGDYSIASFNVLNYFTTLGEDVASCDAFDDRFGNPVASDCDVVRGAYSKEAFADQQAKIVAAINALGVDVLGLEEIENTATVTGEPARRDEALAGLVSALNAAGGNWAYVPSPEQVGTNEDVIRVGFIYNPATVAPVGASRIFDDPAFTGTARQPLAQEFQPADGEAAAGARFVAVVNHFKSKGSVVDGDADTGDGQGNNARVRVRQSEALLAHLGEQADWDGVPTFLLGDLNSYSREDAVTTLEDAGFTNIAAKFDAGVSYQFAGRIGSLDHALGNASAMALVQDAAVWDINADEAIAFEYSRRNYNAVDFYDATPFRASDHDPIKVGFNLTAPTPAAPKPASGSSSSSPLSLGGVIAAVLGAAGILGLILAIVFPEQRDRLLGRG